MSVAVTTAQPAQVLTSQHIDTITNLVLGGDLSKMDNQARVAYYLQLCQSLSLNAHTQPFQILKFQGKEIMYATKSCTEQLRKLWGVSVTKLERHQEGDVVVVVAYVVDGTGRTDAGTGAVAIANLRGEALANAFMKAETKAKRRATLSICGLGILDESELDTMPQATQVAMPTAEAGTSATVVEEPAPVAATLDEAKIAGHRTRMMYARSLVEVQQIWKEIPKHLAPKLLADKDAAKLRLSKQPAPKPVRDEQLMKEFVEQPSLAKHSSVGANGTLAAAQASDAQRHEIQRLCNLQTISEGEKADMLKVLYKLDESRAADMIFKLNNEIAFREGRDADGEWRQALQKFIHKYAGQLSEANTSDLAAMVEDSSVHWQTIRTAMLNIIEGIKQAAALANAA